MYKCTQHKGALNIQVYVIFLLNAFSEQPRLSLSQMYDTTQAATVLRRRHFHLHRCTTHHS